MVALRSSPPGSPSPAPRAVVGRRLHRAGQQGRFADAELRGRLIEEALGRGVDAGGAAAEIDPVQIERQDLLLGELPLQPHRQHQLLHLAPDRPGGGQEQVAGELLGDGRARPPAMQWQRRSAKPAARTPMPDHVEAHVAVEAPVLDGDEGGGHVGRKLVDVHRRRVLAASHRDQDAAAIQVGDRRLSVDVVELGGVGQVPGEHRQEGHHEDDGPHPRHRAPIEDLLGSGRAAAESARAAGRAPAGAAAQAAA